MSITPCPKHIRDADMDEFAALCPYCRIERLRGEVDTLRAAKEQAERERDAAKTERDKLEQYNVEFDKQCSILREAVEKVMAIWYCTCDNTKTCPHCVAAEALRRIGGGE